MNQIVCLVFKKDKEAKNFVQIPKTYRTKGEKTNLDKTAGDIILSKIELEVQELSAMVCVNYLSLYFSLLLNFMYSIFLQEVMVSKLFGFLITFFRPTFARASLNFSTKSK